MEGWISLHRQLLDKAIWQCSTTEQKVILITLLLLANHDSKEWEWKGKKFICKPGQLVTSLPSLAGKCGKGITIQNVRTALTKFKKYDFLTDESTGTGRLITIVNWGLYQGSQNITNRQINRPLTDDQQTPNRRLTPNNNDNNDNNYNNDNKSIYSDVITYLNMQANKNYKPTTKKSKSLIEARVKEGFTFDEFKMVIDIKVKEWLNDEKMNIYLRPETLFGNKFEGYLNQRDVVQTNETKKDEYAFDMGKIRNQLLGRS